MQGQHLPLPDVWGEGQLFDFSGIDGVTSWSHPTTATTLADNIGFIFHSLDEKLLRVAVEINGVMYEAPEPERCAVVCSDLVDLKIYEEAGLLVRAAFIYIKKGTVIGRIIVTCKGALPEMKLYLISASASTTLIESKCGAIIFRSLNEIALLEVCFEEAVLCDPLNVFNRQRWVSLPFEGKAQHKAVLLQLKLEKQIERTYQAVFRYSIRGKDSYDREQEFPEFAEEYKKKVIFFKKLPVPRKTDYIKQNTLSKAFSVLKCNVYSPEGSIRYLWTTPDKFPHRNMWLWDSAFQSLGYKYISGKIGEDCIKAVLSMQAEDGYVPLSASPQNMRCEQDGAPLTQPPTLAWAAWNVYQYTKSSKFLRYCLPRLCRQIKWLIVNRDENSNGLLEWHIRDDAVCPCGECGMDNSPRFLQGINIDAIDLNALVVNEINHIQKISNELGVGQDGKLKKIKEQIARLMNERMWDEKDNFYYDLRFDGQLLKIKSISSFFPLLAGIPAEEQARHLIRHLTDPEEFWSEFPVRTLALNEPAFDRNMWRGPVWVNCNYLIICGLREYGYNDLANEIARFTVDQLSRWYNYEGSIFELYHDKGLSPLELPVKDSHHNLTSSVLRDYGWSCAVYVQLLLEGNKQISDNTLFPQSSS